MLHRGYMGLRGVYIAGVIYGLYRGYMGIIQALYGCYIVVDRG